MNTINNSWKSAVGSQKKGCVLIIDDRPDNIHVLDNILKLIFDSRKNNTQ